jgi:hypothetical protein
LDLTASLVELLPELELAVMVSQPLFAADQVALAPDLAQRLAFQELALVSAAATAQLVLVPVAFVVGSRFG